ncbi:MAG: hypothetical protein FJ399_12560 [Verrucomicrobia bacterium]|nr:hypothetical protein [Verrucomicrobiota bacterium]
MAADAGVTRGDFDAINAEVAAVVERWPEFAQAAGLPPAAIEHTASIHRGLATLLETEAPAKRSKRRKFWE